MDNDGSTRLEPGAETVYGTHDDNAMVMSEKVNVICVFSIHRAKGLCVYAEKLSIYCVNYGCVMIRMLDELFGSLCIG